MGTWPGALAYIRRRMLGTRSIGQVVMFILSSYFNVLIRIVCVSRFSAFVGMELQLWFELILHCIVIILRCIMPQRGTICKRSWQRRRSSGRLR